MNTQHTLQAIRTRYHAATPHHGPRISASVRSGTRLYIPSPTGKSEDHRRAAVLLAARMGWATELTAGQFGRDTYWLPADGFVESVRTLQTVLAKIAGAMS